jgi:hypothetical protein
MAQAGLNQSTTRLSPQIFCGMGIMLMGLECISPTALKGQYNVRHILYILVFPNLWGN